MVETTRMVRGKGGRASKRPVTLPRITFGLGSEQDCRRIETAELVGFQRDGFGVYSATEYQLLAYARLCEAVGKRTK